MHKLPLLRIDDEKRNLALLKIVGCRTQLSLVRNLANELFPPQMKERDARRLGLELARFFCERYQGTDVTDNDHWSEVVNQEYGLAALEDRGPAYRLVRVKDTNKRTIWIEFMSANHLTFSVTGIFWNFEQEMLALQSFVEHVEKKLAFAYDEKLGYLATQVTLIGSGLRIRTWMHLNALVRYGYLEALTNAMETMRVFVDMEEDGATPEGHLFILFNRSANHATPVTIVEAFKRALMLVAWHEMNCRQRFYLERPFELFDLLEAARAQLSSRFLLSERESLNALSDLQMGASIGKALKRASIQKDLAEFPWFFVGCDHLFPEVFGQGERQRLIPLLPKSIQKNRQLLLSACRASWMRRYAHFEYTKQFLKRVKSI